jgi:hypothetical protein
MSKPGRWISVGIIVTGPIVILFILVLFNEPSPPNVSRQVKGFLGNRTVSILAGATRVEVFRVSSVRDIKGTSKMRIGEYPVVSTGKEQGKPFAQRLSAVLFDNRNYEFAGGTACNFAPGVAFRIGKDGEADAALRFWKDGEYVDVLLCFACNEFAVIGKKVWGPITLPHTAKEDFLLRPELVKLAKAAFPKDKEIQALKEKHDD